MTTSPARTGFVISVLALQWIIACSDTQAPTPGPGKPSEMFFRDVTEATGIGFKHVNGASKRKFLPEIMGSGGCALDYDGDGWIDLYFIQSGELPDRRSDKNQPGNQLYRNRGDGSFADVTDNAGVADSGYGMGAACADFDNDSDTDIYVVNFGPDVLYRNNGDGTFSQVSDELGIRSPLWGSSATFFDADRDGHLDLYVTNYLDFTIDKHVDCGAPSRGIYSYCSPDVYAMAPDVFFRGSADSVFRDFTIAAGLQDKTGNGKGLGAVAADFNNDGWPDLYIANDSTPNYLYQNRGDGTFEEVGLFLGVSHNEDGLTEAGMGTDAGDVNGDGWLDIFVTNLSNETNSLYLGGKDIFIYSTRDSGLYAASYLPVGFGTDLADFDNDGDLDLFVANGHVIDNIELTDDAQTFAQPAQLFLNDGSGTFTLVETDLVGDVAAPRVGRGSITLDIDNDGQLDLVIMSNNGRARIFRNVWRDIGNWIGFRLVAKTVNRDAIGARVTVQVGDHVIIGERKAGSSYQTSGDSRMHFGLGAAAVVDRVTVRWPGGATETYDHLETGRYHTIEEAVDLSR